MCQKHPLPALNRALVDFLRLVVVGLEEIRDEIDGQWEDDRRVLLRRNGVQRLQDKRAHMLRSRYIKLCESVLSCRDCR